MSRGSCSRRSSALRRNISCASSRPMSAAASARKSSSMPRRRSAPGRRRRSTGLSNGLRTGRRPSSRTRTVATMSRTPNWRSTRAARSPACACIRSPTSALISRPSRPPCRPIFTGRCSRANTRSRASIAKSTRSTPTPRLSTPIAAPGARRRRSSSSASSKSRRVKPARIRPSFDARTSSIRSRIRPRSSWLMTRAITRARSTRRWRSPITGGCQHARPLPRPRANCAAWECPPISKRAASRRPRRSVRSAPASAFGNRRKCASIRSARSRF